MTSDPVVVLFLFASAVFLCVLAGAFVAGCCRLYADINSHKRARGYLAAEREVAQLEATWRL